MTTISTWRDAIENITRELRMKLALARLLPYEIEITDLNNFKWKCGEYAGELLRETEWDYVVKRIDRNFCFFVPRWEMMAEEILRRQRIEW